MISDYKSKYNYLDEDDYGLSGIEVLEEKLPLQLLFPLGILLIGVLYGRYKVRNKKDSSFE